MGYWQSQNGDPSDGKVARETQYFGDPFKPGPSRAHLVDLSGPTLMPSSGS